MMISMILMLMPSLAAVVEVVTAFALPTTTLVASSNRAYHKLQSPCYHHNHHQQHKWHHLHYFNDDGDCRQQQRRSSSSFSFSFSTTTILFSQSSYNSNYDPFDYFDDYEDVDEPPPIGYPQNNNDRIGQQPLILSKKNNSLNEEQRTYRNTKYNRDTSWRQQQVYRSDQKSTSSRNNFNYYDNNNNMRGQQQATTEDYQRSSGSPSSWSQKLYDVQNNAKGYMNNEVYNNNFFPPKPQSQSQLPPSSSSSIQGTNGSSRYGDGYRYGNSLYNNRYSSNISGGDIGRGGGGLTKQLGSSIGEGYTDNFRRGPGSEDFRQFTRQTRRGSSRNNNMNNNDGSMNSIGKLSSNRNSALSSMGQRRNRNDVRDYGTSNSLGQWYDDQRYDEVDPWDTINGRQGRTIDDDDDNWNDEREEEYYEPRRQMRRATTQQQQVVDGNIGQWQKEQGQRGQKDKYGGSYGVGTRGNSYYYEQPLNAGDYTYNGGVRRRTGSSSERSRRDTDDLMGRGVEEEEGYDYNNNNRREVAFNQSRYVPPFTPPIKKNSNNKQQQVTKRRPSSPTLDVTPPSQSKSIPNKQSSPTFTYQNEKDDYRKRGEQQSQRYDREIAFGNRDDTNNQFQERRKSSLETKSTTFGQQQNKPRSQEVRMMQQQQQQQQQQQPLQQQQYNNSGGMQRPVDPQTRHQQQQQQVEQQRQSPQPTRGFTKQLKSVQKPQQYNTQRRSNNDRENTNEEPLWKQIINSGANFVDQLTGNNNNYDEQIRNRSSSSKSSSEEDRITRVLLADARSYLMSDTTIRNIFGDTIKCDEIISRSYTSTMICQFHAR